MILFRATIPLLRSKWVPRKQVTCSFLIEKSSYLVRVERREIWHVIFIDEIEVRVLGPAKIM